MCLQFRLAYTWISQVEKFALADNKLRKPTVAEGRCGFIHHQLDLFE